MAIGLSSEIRWDLQIIGEAWQQVFEKQTLRYDTMASWTFLFFIHNPLT